MSPEIASVVDFWRAAGPDAWFAKNDAFDADFRLRFLDLHFEVSQRQHDDWNESPEGSLALMVLLDQFPRNSFRGTAHMFATDPLARYFARRAVTAGHDKALDEGVRNFLYLPFMHSENLADQEFCVDLYRTAGSENLKYAVEHRDIVKQFGRFPHRNPALGRETTPQEKAFLAAGGFAG